MGPLLLGLGVTAQACVSSLGCSSTATSTLFAFLGFAFTAGCNSREVSRNRSIPNRCHFHKSEKFNYFSGTRVHQRHSARLLLNAKRTFLLAVRRLLKILKRIGAAGSLLVVFHQSGLNFLPAHFQFCIPVVA